MRWHRGNHNGPHVSMHIHAFPPHRLTATTLQRAIEEMLKSEWGMDEMGRGGGQEKKHLDLNSFTFLHVWTVAHCVKR